MAENQPGPDITQLVAEHHHAVYGYAYRLAGSAAEAEDLTQQVFLTAYRKLDQLRQVDRPRSWLFAILRHAFLKDRGKRRPVSASSLDLDLEAVPENLPEDGAVDPEELDRALERLPEKFRVVLGMFYYENCSYREIAEQLGVPIGTVMSRLARAKAHLRAQLFGSESDGQTAGRVVSRWG